MAETTNQQNAGQQDVMRALASVAQAVLGSEFRAMHDSMQALERTVTQRLDEAAKSTAASVDAVKKELGARIDQLNQEIAKVSKAQADGLAATQSSAAAAQAKIEKALGEIDQRLQKTAEATTRDIATTRDQLRKELTDYQQRVGTDFNAVSAKFAAEEEELGVLQREEKRIATVLSSFARAFTGTEAAEPQQAPQQRAQKPAPQAAPAPAKQGANRAASAASGKGGDAVDLEHLPSSGEVTDNIDKMFNLGK